MAGPQRNRCLYEILGLSRDCSQDEIRSAYRRLALQLHPDKIAASGAAISPESATSTFQELLHAYELLSDPKERSYYDSHRSQILFTNPSSSSSKPNKPSSVFDVDLYSFFSTSVFSGFSDSGRGFYKVYGDLFTKLHNQELWFSIEMGIGSDSVSPAPLIGNLESPYLQVTAFYNYWLSFCTVMDFGWVDEYDAGLGANRRSRRVMEEENKKARKKARREYSDSVRGLAAFVKKRDKRVIDMMVKKNLEEEKRRAMEKEKKKEEERKKLERAMKYEEPEWAKVEDDEIVDDSEDDKKKKRGDEFYCIVCNKKFKSDKQWKNHEQSKKHRDKVAELRVSFKEEEEISVNGDHEEEEITMNGDEEEDRVGLNNEHTKEVKDSDGVEELCVEVEEDLKLREEEVDAKPLEEDKDRKSGSDDEASILEAMLSGRKNRKGVRLSRHDSSASGDTHPVDDDESTMEYDTRRRNHRTRTTRRKTAREADAEDVREDTDDVCGDEGEAQSQKQDASNMEQRPSSSNEDVAGLGKGKGDRATEKKQKHQQLNENGDRKKGAVIDSKKPSKGKKQKGSSKASSNSCGTCGESFETRNKLFAHLGDSGHAMLKSR